MMLVNVIPAVSTYAVAVPGSKGKPAQVQDLRRQRRQACSPRSPPSRASRARRAWPWAMSTTTASTISSSAPARTTLRRSLPIRARPPAANMRSRPSLPASRRSTSAARGGVSVAASQIDGSTADNIIVGSGAGVPSEVKVFRSDLPSQSGKAPSLFSTFAPYPDDSSGVSVASGFVDFATGRYSIVTAPGPGSAAQVKVFVFPLMPPIGQKTKPQVPRAQAPRAKARPPTCVPRMRASRISPPPSCRSASTIKAACHSPPAGSAATLGGAERIVVGQLAGPAR